MSDKITKTDTNTDTDKSTASNGLIGVEEKEELPEANIVNNDEDYNPSSNKLSLGCAITWLIIAVGAGAIVGFLNESWQVTGAIKGAVLGFIVWLISLI